MNCAGIHQKLHLLAGESAPAVLCAAAEAHARGCPRCARLLACARGEVSGVEPVGAPTDLLAGVLRATAGPACTHLPERLAALADGELEGVDRELVLGHLSSCADCREIRDALALLSQELPKLVEIEPDDGFLREVLARTVLRDAARRPGSSRAAPAWQRLWRRPRSALELAYGGALAFTLFFGSPQELARELSVRMPARSEAPVASRSADRRAADSVFDEAVLRARRYASRPREELASLPAPGSARKVIETAGRVLATMEDGGRLVRAIARHFLRGDLEAAWSEWNRFWEASRRSWSNPPGASRETQDASSQARRREAGSGPSPAARPGFPGEPRSEAARTLPREN